ncbi:MAG: SusC/RagA family TonB-linked outer membrane protein [Bacteroidaceae bacterium]|nr:SusC/RagA family TonB-linked outer membrane protein [Bacteroidaceae bacterium]
MKLYKTICAALAISGSLTVAAQENMNTVTGRVLDAATGQPLVGVIVTAYGDARYSGMTDEHGDYELKVPAYTRSVSMTVEGYNLLQTAINNGRADAWLYHEAFSADYAKSTTATISSLAEGFDNTSELSIDPLISQRLGADVHTISRGGLPGVGSVMLMNGINSLNANAQPLIVVDGFILDMQHGREMLHDGYFNNMLTNINVNDIESVEVLKNGTALYGSKGANGVILIKTKRSKSMATKIDVTINGRYELVPRLPEMMGAEDYRLYTTELLSNKTASLGSMKYLNTDPTYFYYNQYHNNTDWTDQVYENSFSQNYGINVQGGDDVASYNLSVGYSMANSPFKKNEYSRFSMRLNSDIEIMTGLNVRFDASYSDVDRSLFDDGAPANPTSGVITSPSFLGLVKAPFLSPYAFDKAGNVSQYLAEADDYLEGMFQGEGRLANPTAILHYGEGENRNSFGNRLIMFSVTPRYEINKNLSVSEQFTLGLVNTNEMYYLPIHGVPTFKVEGLDEGTTLQNFAQSMAARQTAIQSDTRITWKNRYGAHDVSVMGGFRFISNNYNLTNQKGYNTGNDKTPNMNNSLQFKTTGGADDKTREMAWYALAGYNYAERFYLNGGLSASASSRFGADAPGLEVMGVKWGLFPSIEGAWVLSNEKWLADARGINYLRLNVGYDMTGNDAIDYTASRSYFLAQRMLGDKATGLVIGNIGNTELQWETTNRVTAGLQGHFLNNRLSVRLGWFKSWTDNLLSLSQLAWTSGLKENWSNGGKLENSGFDVTASVKAINLKNFRWELGASVGRYKNEVTALPNDNRTFETDIYGATIQTKVGQPVGVFYGWKTEGVYATADAAKADGKYLLNDKGDRIYFGAGDVSFKDFDGDQVIGKEDRTVIGDPNPDIYGNIFTTINWKNLTLSAAFNYSLGNDIYNYQRSLLEGGSLFMNQTTAMAGRWTTENQQTSIPRIAYKDPMGNSRFSDRWIEDGSYLRLSSVTLSYHIPILSTYLQGITIWGNAANLFTISRYLGNNPDCAMSGSVLSQGIDRGLISPGRSFSLGVNINL